MSEPRRPEQLVVLGSGTALPTADRGSPGYLLTFAGGEGILLDTGPGSVRAAAREGHPPECLRAVILSHFHVDHCLDLFALLFGLKNPALAAQSLTVIGPVGLKALLQRMEDVFGSWVQLPDSRLRLVELEPGPFRVEVGPCLLEGECMSMPHLPHSLGFRLRGVHKQLAYSGDTGQGEAPIALGKDVDIYILEAALPDGSDANGHLTPDQAGRIAALANPGHLVLTHFYPATERSDPARSAARHFHGPLTLAHDGLRLNL